MNSIAAILPYIQILLSVLLVAGVLTQRSEAALGAAFGDDSWSSVKHARRGAEKAFFIATIVVAILFVLSAFAALLVK